MCDVLDIDEEGITGLRTYYDAATLLTQLGLAVDLVGTDATA